MRFNTLRDCISLCRMANISLMIWGQRGVGKSSVIAQYCSQHQYGCVNMRLSQMEASDIRGLPDRIQGRTQYLPPADMPSGGLSWEDYEAKLQEITDPTERMRQSVLLTPQLNNGILFLDEINRAQDDVLQAAFELVLDRKIGQYVLPEGWSIVCAGNYNEGSYITNGFTDAAFLDRFCHVQLSDGEATMEDWVQFMSNTHGDTASSVIEFVAQDLNRLDGAVEGSLGFTIQPSRRSWESVTKVVQAAKQLNVSDEALTSTIQGLVGVELGASFGRYSCPVSPRDLINDGVKKWKKQLDELDRNQQVGLMWGLTSYLKKKIDNENESNVALDYAEWMAHHSTEHDLVAAFLKSLTNDDNASVRGMKSVMVNNPAAAKMINGILNSGQEQEETFISRLMKREKLHDIVSRISWGQDTDDSE